MSSRRKDKNTKCCICGKLGHSIRDCYNPRDYNRIMTARLRDILKCTTQKLLQEQSAHINFLSEHLDDGISSEICDDHDHDSSSDDTDDEDDTPSLHSVASDENEEIRTIFVRNYFITQNAIS